MSHFWDLIVEALFILSGLSREGGLYTPGARLALLAAPCTPCTPYWQRPVRPVGDALLIGCCVADSCEVYREVLA